MTVYTFLQRASKEKAHIGKPHCPDHFRLARSLTEAAVLEDAGRVLSMLVSQSANWAWPSVQRKHHLIQWAVIEDLPWAHIPVKIGSMEMSQETSVWWGMETSEGEHEVVSESTWEKWGMWACACNPHALSSKQEEPWAWGWPSLQISELHLLHSCF